MGGIKEKITAARRAGRSHRHFARQQRQRPHRGARTRAGRLDLPFCGKLQAGVQGTLWCVKEACREEVMAQAGRCVDKRERVNEASPSDRANTPRAVGHLKKPQEAH